MALFESIVAKCSPAIIVETGTFLGTTTEYLATTQLPIYSVKHDRRTYGFAKTRLWCRRNVHLKRGDSREALLAWLDGPVHNHSGGPVLIYLDAHWESDVPLSEELVVIFDHRYAIVMIDDFRVPFDNGYGYDDYGEGKALVPAYIKSAVRALQSLAYVYYEDEPGRRSAAKLLDCDEARRIAANVAGRRAAVSFFL